ncbi:MAG: hypothetical protein WCA56_19795 [Xanthobacteraceae bacterium]
MRLRVTGTSALIWLLAAIAPGNAQVPPLLPQSAPHPAPAPMPPPPGFVSSYEIMHTLRAAGFDPLAPPLREGTIYVARATDYRGILMRVVLDARTGAIRDANRILPGPGNYGGPYGGAYGSGPYDPGPYGPGPYGSGPYGPEPDGPGPYGRVGMMPPPGVEPPDSDMPMTTSTTPTMMPSIVRPPARASLPPLPRPRPPELASRKPADDAKPAVDAKPADVTKPIVASDPKLDPKPDPKPAPVATTTAPAATTAQTTAPAAPTVKPGKPPSTLSINN